MICGFCSSEQPISSECRKCFKEVTKISSGNISWLYLSIGAVTRFWEGGKGTRNKNAMSNKDPHKFAGLGKTLSRKKRSEMKKK